MPELLNLLDDPVLFSPVPKRDELGWRRFMRSLKIRPVVHQHFSKRHSVSPGTIRISAALEQ
jgi:hypothetical protein